MKLQLPQVTLLGVDCVNVQRLQAALDASIRDIDFGAVKLLTSLPTDDPRLVSIPHLGSINKYSRFCIEDLHKYVDTQYVIMIQYDGFILHADLWDSEFLHYDYIGGPMFTQGWTPIQGYPLSTPLIVGNGGFTLRSKKFLDLCAQFVIDKTITHQTPEDVALSYWYRQNFEAAGMKYPTVEFAMKFCINAKYQEEYIAGFGFHGFYVKNMESVLNAFPEYPMHFFLPRIRWARLMQLKKSFIDVALEGKYTFSSIDGKNSTDIWLTIRDEDRESVWKNRREYISTAGNIIHFLDNDNSIHFVVKTTAGEIPFIIHFQTLSESTAPLGALELFNGV